MGKKNVTFVVTDEVDREIEIRAFLENKQKSEILLAALNLYFLKNKRATLPNEAELTQPITLPQRKAKAVNNQR